MAPKMDPISLNNRASGLPWSAPFAGVSPTVPSGGSGLDFGTPGHHFSTDFGAKTYPTLNKHTTEIRKLRFFFGLCFCFFFAFVWFIFAQRRTTNAETRKTQMRVRRSRAANTIVVVVVVVVVVIAIEFVARDRRTLICVFVFQGWLDGVVENKNNRNIRA